MTRVRGEPRSFDQGRRKNNDLDSDTDMKSKKIKNNEVLYAYSSLTILQLFFLNSQVIFINLLYRISYGKLEF